MLTVRSNGVLLLTMDQHSIGAAIAFLCSFLLIQSQATISRDAHFRDPITRALYSQDHPYPEYHRHTLRMALQYIKERNLDFSKCLPKYANSPDDALIEALIWLKNVMHMTCEIKERISALIVYNVLKNYFQNHPMTGLHCAISGEPAKPSLDYMVQHLTGNNNGKAIECIYPAKPTEIALTEAPHFTIYEKYDNVETPALVEEATVVKELKEIPIMPSLQVTHKNEEGTTKIVEDESKTTKIVEDESKTTKMVENREDESLTTKMVEHQPTTKMIDDKEDESDTNNQKTTTKMVEDKQDESQTTKMVEMVEIQHQHQQQQQQEMETTKMIKQEMETTKHVAVDKEDIDEQTQTTKSMVDLSIRPYGSVEYQEDVKILVTTPRPPSPPSPPAFVEERVETLIPNIPKVPQIIQHVQQQVQVEATKSTTPQILVVPPIAPIVPALPQVPQVPQEKNEEFLPEITTLRSGLIEHHDSKIPPAPFLLPIDQGARMQVHHQPMITPPPLVLQPANVMVTYNPGNSLNKLVNTPNGESVNVDVDVKKVDKEKNHVEKGLLNYLDVVDEVFTEKPSTLQLQEESINGGLVTSRPIKKLTTVIVESNGDVAESGSVRKVDEVDVESRPNVELTENVEKQPLPVVLPTNPVSPQNVDSWNDDGDINPVGLNPNPNQHPDKEIKPYVPLPPELGHHKAVPQFMHEITPHPHVSHPIIQSSKPVFQPKLQRQEITPLPKVSEQGQQFSPQTEVSKYPILNHQPGVFHPKYVQEITPGPLPKVSEQPNLSHHPNLPHKIVDVQPSISQEIPEAPRPKLPQEIHKIPQINVDVLHPIENQKMTPLLQLITEAPHQEIHRIPQLNVDVPRPIESQKITPHPQLITEAPSSILPQEIHKIPQSNVNVPHSLESQKITPHPQLITKIPHHQIQEELTPHPKLVTEAPRPILQQEIHEIPQLNVDVPRPIESQKITPHPQLITEELHHPKLIQEITERPQLIPELHHPKLIQEITEHPQLIPELHHPKLITEAPLHLTEIHETPHPIVHQEITSHPKLFTKMPHQTVHEIPQLNVDVSHPKEYQKITSHPQLSTHHPNLIQEITTRPPTSSHPKLITDLMSHQPESEIMQEKVEEKVEKEAELLEMNKNVSQAMLSEKIPTPMPTPILPKFNVDVSHPNIKPKLEVIPHPQEIHPKLKPSSPHELIVDGQHLHPKPKVDELQPKLIQEFPNVEQEIKQQHPPQLMHEHYPKEEIPKRPKIPKFIEQLPILPLPAMKEINPYFNPMLNQYPQYQINPKEELPRPPNFNNPYFNPFKPSYPPKYQYQNPYLYPYFNPDGLGLRPNMFGPVLSQDKVQPQPKKVNSYLDLDQEVIDSREREEKEQENYYYPYNVDQYLRRPQQNQQQPQLQPNLPFNIPESIYNQYPHMHFHQKQPVPEHQHINGGLNVHPHPHIQPNVDIQHQQPISSSTQSPHIHEGHLNLHPHMPNKEINLHPESSVKIPDEHEHGHEHQHQIENVKLQPIPEVKHQLPIELNKELNLRPEPSVKVPLEHPHSHLHPKELNLHPVPIPHQHQYLKPIENVNLQPLKPEIQEKPIQKHPLSIESEELNLHPQPSYKIPLQHPHSHPVENMNMPSPPEIQERPIEHPHPVENVNLPSPPKIQEKHVEYPHPVENLNFPSPPKIQRKPVEHPHPVENMNIPSPPQIQEKPIKHPHPVENVSLPSPLEIQEKSIEHPHPVENINIPSPPQIQERPVEHPHPVEIMNMPSSPKIEEKPVEHPQPVENIHLPLSPQIQEKHVEHPHVELSTKKIDTTQNLPIKIPTEPNKDDEELETVKNPSLSLNKLAIQPSVYNPPFSTLVPNYPHYPRTSLNPHIQHLNQHNIPSIQQQPHHPHSSTVHFKVPYYSTTTTPMPHIQQHHSTPLNPLHQHNPDIKMPLNKEIERKPSSTLVPPHIQPYSTLLNQQNIPDINVPLNKDLSIQQQPHHHPSSTLHFEVPYYSTTTPMPHIQQHYSTPLSPKHINMESKHPSLSSLIEEPYPSPSPSSKLVPYYSTQTPMSHLNPSLNNIPQVPRMENKYKPVENLPSRHNAVPEKIQHEFQETRRITTMELEGVTTKVPQMLTTFFKLETMPTKPAFTVTVPPTAGTTMTTFAYPVKEIPGKLIAANKEDEKFYDIVRAEVEKNQQLFVNMSDESVYPSKLVEMVHNKLSKTGANPVVLEAFKFVENQLKTKEIAQIPEYDDNDQYGEYSILSLFPYPMSKSEEYHYKVVRRFIYSPAFHAIITAAGGFQFDEGISFMLYLIEKLKQSGTANEELISTLTFYLHHFEEEARHLYSGRLTALIKMLPKPRNQTEEMYYIAVKKLLTSVDALHLLSGNKHSKHAKPKGFLTIIIKMMLKTHNENDLIIKALRFYERLFNTKTKTEVHKKTRYSFAPILTLIPKPSSPIEEKYYELIQEFLVSPNVTIIIPTVSGRVFPSDAALLAEVVRLLNTNPDFSTIASAFQYYADRLEASKIITTEVRKQFNLTSILLDSLEVDKLVKEEHDIFNELFDYISALTAENLKDFTNWTEAKTKAEFTALFFRYLENAIFVPLKYKTHIRTLLPRIRYDGEGALPI